MSARNTQQNKKLRSLRRALRKGRLPRYIDLYEWLTDHGHTQTNGEARKLILAGRVKSESHSLGTRLEEGDDGEMRTVIHARVPASLRGTIRVEAA